MAVKNLGQEAPAANTDVDLYTVPAGKSTVCSSLFICNRSSTTVRFRMAVRVNGAALADKCFLYYDVELPMNDTLVSTSGVTLAAGDVVTVRGSTGDLSFNLFGDES